MKNNWVQLSQSELSELDKHRGKKEQYKFQGHTFRHNSLVGKSVCERCGLVALNNKLSEWAVDKGCNYKDHPDLPKKVTKFTKRKWEQ